MKMVEQIQQSTTLNDLLSKPRAEFALPPAADAQLFTPGIHYD